MLTINKVVKNRKEQMWRIHFIFKGFKMFDSFKDFEVKKAASFVCFQSTLKITQIRSNII